jgi:SagB-type dehydrogenase family enzyme
VSRSPAPLLRSTVYWPAADAEDPAEAYHEASRLYPALVHRQGVGLERLAVDPALQAAARRAGRWNPQRPRLPLRPAKPPGFSLWRAFDERRSRSPDAPLSLDLPTLALVLQAAYGGTSDERRTVPSAGALYPLELFVLVQRVVDVPCGAYRLTTDEPALELVRRESVASALAEATPLPELVTSAAAVIFFAGTFWRSRFKYGLRGYRFTLLEAGHAAQNVVLAAAAVGASALPLGGFYDARIDALLGLDGVDESVLYGIVLGGVA